MFDQILTPVNILTVLSVMGFYYITADALMIGLEVSRPRQDRLKSMLPHFAAIAVVSVMVSSIKALRK